MEEREEKSCYKYNSALVMQQADTREGGWCLSHCMSFSLVRSARSQLLSFVVKSSRERRKVGEVSVRSLVRDWRNVTAGRGRAGQHHSLQLGLAQLASWWTVHCSTSNSQR